MIKLSEMLKEIDADSPNAWAKGCAKCKFGLIAPPPATNYTAPLYRARTIQASQHELVFCDCKAGDVYRKYLRQDGPVKTYVRKAEYERYVEESDYVPPMRVV